MTSKGHPSSTAKRSFHGTHLSPPLLLTVIWASLFCLRSSPLMQLPPLEMRTGLYLLACYVAFLAGYAMLRLPWHAGRVAPSVAPPARNIGKFVRLTMWFAAIGMIGAVVRSLDMFFGRGLDFSEGVAAARLANIDIVSSSGAGQSALSGLGRLLMAFSSVAAMVAVLRFEQFPLRTARAILVSFSIVLALSAIEGGRNTIAVNGLLLMSCMIIRRRQGLVGMPASAKTRRVFRVLMGGALVFFCYVFLARLQALGHDLNFAFDALEGAFDVQFSETLKNLTDETLLSIAVSVSGLAIYATHAINELNWLLEWASRSSPAWGAYNFDLVAIALERLGFDGVRFDYDSLTRPGVYVTAVGELVADFGISGTVFVCLGLGAFFGHAWRKSRFRQAGTLDLALAFGLTFLMASPLYSIVAGFLGIILAIAVFGICSNAIRRAAVSRPGHRAFA